MTVKVSISPDVAGVAVYREEAVDDSGQPSMVGPWKFFDVGAAPFVHRGTRIVIEQYDKDRHGRI